MNGFVYRQGTELLVNNQTLGVQLMPTMVGLSNGGFVVSWTDDSRQNGNNSYQDIKAQVFSAGGAKVGAEFFVNTQTDGVQFDPRITGLNSGGFVVSWVDYSGQGGDASYSSIKAQVFDASGAKVGTEFLVNTRTADSQSQPTITGLSSGGFVASWVDNSGQGGDDSNTGIKAQVFDASGTKVGTEFLVNTRTLYTQNQPTITGLSGGGFVVSWVDGSGQGGDASYYGIKAQVFDASGAKVGTEFLVNTQTADNQSQPTVTGLSNGGFVVSWTDYSGQGGDTSYSGIKAQVFDASGAKVGTEFLVNTRTTGGQADPTIAGLSNGGFVVSWEDISLQGGDASGTGIKAQVFDASGTKVGTEFLVNTQTASYQRWPTITGLSDGGFVVGWADISGQGGDNSDWSIKAQVFGIAPTNSAPVTNIDNYALDAGAPFVLSAAQGVLANDTDADVYGGTLSAVLVAGPSHGTLKLETDGGFTYTPDAGFLGADSFTYSASDGELSSSPTAVSLSVEPVNHAPVLNSLPITLPLGREDTPYTITRAQLLTGYADPDGDTLTIQDLSAGGGTFTAHADGSGWTFTPPANYDGVVVLNYTISDGRRGGTVSISRDIYFAPIDDKPVAYRQGSEFLVNTEIGSTQYQPTITGLSNGGFVISWMDASAQGGDDSRWGIKAQVFNASGAKVGTEFLVNTQTANNQSVPTITGLSNGGFVVSWVDNSGQGGDASGTGIKAQVFDAGGTKVGTEFLVNTQTARDQSAPMITGLSNGGFVVSWVDNSGQGGDASGTGIKAQLFAANGTRVGTEFLVNTRTADSQSQPTITGLSNGGFVVSWADNSGQGGDASGTSIKAQVFDAGGTKVGTEFLVNTQTADYQSQPTITGLSNGGFVVSWSDRSGQGGDASGYGIKAQLFDASGTKIGTEVLVNSQTFLDQVAPTITGLSHGGFVVSWQEYANYDDLDINYDVKAQVFNSSGAKIGTEFLVNTSTYDEQSQPAITSLNSGGFVVTWYDYSGDGGDAWWGSVKAQVFGIDLTNYAPAANNDTYTLYEDESLVVPPAEGVLANDTDANRDTLSAVLVSGPAHGTLQLEANGSFTYTPHADFHGADSFTYSASDGTLSSSPTTVNLGVAPVNDLPILTGVPFTLPTGREDTPYTLTKADLLAGYTDPDGDTLTIEYFSINGRAVEPNADGLGWTYIPPADFEGLVPLYYQISDGSGETSFVFNQPISFAPVNDAPVAQDDSGAVMQGASVTLDVLANDTDVDWDELSLQPGSLVVDPAQGTAAIVDGKLVFTAAADFFGTATVAYTVVDGGWPVPLSAVGQATITVTSPYNEMTGREGVDDALAGTVNADRLRGLSGNDTLLGLGGGDRLIGGAGNDRLDGGSGADTMTGGLGDDTYLVDDAGDLITELFGEGSDAVRTSLSTYALADNLEALTYTGTGFFTGTGNDLANLITGGDRGNRLSGGAGADTLVGGLGGDTYLVDNAADVVVENAGGGIDRVLTSVSYTLPENVENLGMGSSASINGTGNALANLLVGNNGRNVLDGGGGADTLTGGLGQDTFAFSTPLGAGNIDRITDFSRADDTIQLDGAVFRDLVNGTLATSAFRDLATGPADADDRILYDAATGGLYFDADGSGVTAAVQFATLDVREVLTAGNFTVIGGIPASNDVLVGTSANELLDGGAGADTMRGAAGDDTYVVDDAGDVVVELPGEGRDTVRTSLASATLADNVEGLTFTGSGSFSGIGNGLDNLLTGGRSNDRLDGGAGADTMVGGLGNDTYVVDNAADVVVEKAGEGTDRVLAGTSYTLGDNVENLGLGTSASLNGTGNALANLLVGNKGHNILDGRGGADTLTGGLGRDTFVLRAGETAGDTVTDFVRGTDTLAFYGFGTDAVLSHGSGSDLYTVTSGDGLTSGSFRLTGVGNLDLSAGAANTDARFFA
ncbi:cadherin-like domain-containing protein [Methylobacterium oryzihabitans]|uniref:Calcium-binding protein n=1 Tax=Methylobacterium oryzihabitans TaxID=2499852 RepID=A0A437NZK3_9HYPH|nr:cadherin-like domain-containing protein [Methylobacterium oryzihabitans]RVU15451.1 calcium-binding protein [Methylobacterium oryzihabitans]